MSIAQAIEQLGETGDTIKNEKPKKMGHRKNVRVGRYNFSGELLKFKDGSKGLLTDFGFYRVAKATK